MRAASTCRSSVSATNASRPSRPRAVPTSTTATLKDFVLATFGSCTSGIRTVANQSTLSIGGGSASATDSATLTIGGATTWSGTVAFSLCGPIATGTCNSGGTLISSQSVNQGTTQPIVSGTATVT